MADDMRDALQFWGSFLQQKRENFGGLRAKTTLFENAFMALNALSQVDQRNRAEVYHPDNMLFAPLLAEDMHTAAQRITETCQLMANEAFAGLCQRFIDYSATLQDTAQRKKAMSLFGVMVASRVNGAACMPPPQYAQPPSQPPPRPMIAPPEPPHPSEPLFRPYMELGPKAGADRIAVDFERFNRSGAVDFLRSFIEYAVSLRSTEKLRTAFALSNKMYVIFTQRHSDNALALPSPKR